MTPVTVFLTGLALTMGVVFLALMYLRSPLLAVLTDLCGTVERAQFWTAFCNITLFLIPFVLALDQKPEALGNPPTVFAISDQIESAIKGLIISVVILGVILSWHISRSREPFVQKETDPKLGAQ
jgi:hypothetical protein